MVRPSLSQLQQIPEAREEFWCTVHGVIEKMNRGKSAHSGLHLFHCLARESFQSHLRHISPRLLAAGLHRSFQALKEVAWLCGGWGQKGFMFVMPLAAGPARLPSQPLEVSCKPAVQTLLTGPFQLPMDLGVTWFLTVSFDFCSPSALGSWQMISLFLPPVCAHTFSLCLLISDHFQCEPNPASLSGKPQPAGVPPNLLKALQEGTWTFQAVGVHGLGWLMRA